MANGVSFSGLGSGIDFNTIRDAILTNRSRPVTLLQTKANDYNNRIENLRQLNSGLAGIISAAKALTERDLGSGRTANTSDANILTSSASSQAVSGQYDISISRIASSLSQATGSFASKTAPILAGGATAATFELRKGGSSSGTQITIDSSNNSLEGLRDAINAANAGISASIVDINGDGSGNQLILNSKETGGAGRVEIFETTSTGTGASLNIRNLNPPDGDFAKLNALFTVNNLQVTRPGNSITDALEGVTLTLKKAGAASISVAPSNEIENKLRGFINSYNAINDAIAGQYKQDSRGRPTGVLAGDSALRAVQQQLRAAVSGVSADNGGSLNSLADIGITTEEGGSLKLDTTILNERLKSNTEDVKALLFGKTTAEKGIFHSISEVASGLGDAVTGTVQTAITGYQNSIKTINENITSRLDSISRLRESLTRQFSAADAAIGQLNGQGTALSNIVKSLQPTQNS